MKKVIAFVAVMMCSLVAIACSQNITKTNIENMVKENSSETSIVNTFEATDAKLIDENIDNSKEITNITYYEVSDGTWKTDSNAYKYKLEVTGRMSAAAVESTFIILSNTDDITFEQAWKASGLSSNMDDYFDPKDAVIVGYILK